MKEIKITAYVADDGTQFDTAEKCMEYEKDIKETAKVKQKFNDIIDFCSTHCDEEADEYLGYNVCINHKCPFWDGNGEHNCMFDCLPYCDINKFD